jgi:hypothetical protein
MSEDFQTTAPAVQQTPADQATAAAIDAVVTHKPAAQTEQLFNRATVEHRRSAVPDQDGAIGIGAARSSGNEPTSLAPMPAAPSIEPTEVSAAIATLNERSEGHSDLVARWGSSFSENLAYAKSAFKDIATNRPDMIQKFEAAGLGDDVDVLEHLSTFGRQQAGRLGDFTIARNNSNPPAFTPAPFSRTPAGPSGNNRGSEETQTELNRLMSENPPGSQRYKDPHIQNRIQQLHRMISGSGSVIGQGGRTA